MSRRSNFVFATLVLVGLVALCWKPVDGFSRGLSSGNTASAAITQSGTESQPEEQLATNHPRDVATYHYNVFRQGQTTVENILTPANVNSNSFGKVNFFTVDGKVDAQPLYANNIPGPLGLQNN